MPTPNDAEYSAARPTDEARPSLLKLPPEILGHIVQNAEKNDHMNLRLVNKELGFYSTRELFREVLLAQAEDSIERFTSIAGNEQIRLVPRHVVIHSQSDIPAADDSLRGDYFEDVTDELVEGLAALSRLTNAESVEVEFTCVCAGEHDFHTTWRDVETVHQRREMLRQVFRAIDDRASVDGTAKIRSLTIINLQNDAVPEFTKSESFRSVTGQLTELHLETVQETNRHGPDNDYDKAELLTFPPHLCADWLKPMSSNLRALSLYHRAENWGPFPGEYDFSDISFPNLETLSLGYYTIAHDDQLDWVLRQKSLKRLILHNCMIVSRMRIREDEQRGWNISKRGWRVLPADGGSDTPEGAAFGYEGTWGHVFDRVGDELPSLADFRFDYERSLHHHSLGHGVDAYSVKRRAACGARIFPERYVVFDMDILPNRWPEAAGSSGDIYSWVEDGAREGRWNFHQQHLDGDHASLERLLEKCHQRARA